ncbi:MAG: hypothetical protein RL185_187, partial [Bacteroidota bacterium]
MAEQSEVNPFLNWDFPTNRMAEQSEVNPIL